ncbi:unnamed protein product [Arctogadus glacialis]
MERVFRSEARRGALQEQNCSPQTPHGHRPLQSDWEDWEDWEHWEHWEAGMGALAAEPACREHGCPGPRSHSLPDPGGPHTGLTRHSACPQHHHHSHQFDGTISRLFSSNPTGNEPPAATSCERWRRSVGLAEGAFDYERETRPIDCLMGHDEARRRKGSWDENALLRNKRGGTKVRLRSVV